MESPDPFGQGFFLTSMNSYLVLKEDIVIGSFLLSRNPYFCFQICW